MVNPRLLAKKFDYPVWMIERYLELLGDEILDFLKANEQPVRKSIRVNTIKTDSETLIDRLEHKGFKLEKISGVKNGYYVEGELPIGATKEYLMGHYFIQSWASMLPPELLNPDKNNLVVDMCAAPGGKTTYISQIMNNTGLVVAVEINPKRIPSLENNIARCGVENTIVLRMDAANLPGLKLETDKILLDAPCTGEGLIRILPERRKSRSMNDILYCSGNQKRLIEAAVKSVKKGGVIVYSTCSLAPEENEEVIDFAVKNLNVKISPIKAVGGPALTSFRDKDYDKSVKLAKRLYPHKHETIGFFVCKLVKKSD